MHGPILALLAAAALVASCGPIQYPTSPDIAPPPAMGPVTAIALVPSPGELPIGGGTARIYVETSASPGVPAPDVLVVLEASSGELSAHELRTDRTGHGAVTWQGTSTATLRATAAAAGVSSSTQLRVLTPSVLPPPSTPLPPLPPPPPLPPLPAPPPALAVSLEGAPARAAVGELVTFQATVRGLQPAERVEAYAWDFDDDGADDATTLSPMRAHAYAAHGVHTARVTVLTAARQASGSARLIVFTP